MLEPEVSLIEKYLQTVCKCFTMTNIKCRGKKEIDLLAINPITGRKFHIESSVWTKRRLSSNGLAKLADKKFNDSEVKGKISEFFGESDYEKWLVVSPQNVNRQLDEYASKLGIEIRYIEEMVRTMMRKMDRYGSRDHILRTLEIVNLKEKWDRTHLHLRPPVEKP
jgi:hypothetical protein